MKVFVYKCMYWHPDDEYGLPMYLEQEVAIFKNREDAYEYYKDFESNLYRCQYNTYTKYESQIVEEEVL